MQTVIDAVRQGGSVAVICNTVGRAQAIFGAVLNHSEVQAGTLLDRDGQLPRHRDAGRQPSDQQDDQCGMKFSDPED